MTAAHPLLPRLLLASAVSVSAIAPAPALSAPPAAAAADPVKAEPMQKDSMTAHHASCAALANGPVSVASDPEEGGQIARTAAHKPKVGDMAVTKKIDTASPKLAESSPSGSSCP
jgi:hypothetical protein